MTLENSAPELSIATKKYGRLYRLPGSDLSQYNLKDDAVLKSLILSGELMPSITNVISVKNSPFLLDWATKLVAQEAVNIASKWPQKLVSEPAKAVKYLKDTAVRERDHWGSQGTNVHNAIEKLALGEDVDLSQYTDYEKACISEWKNWMREFRPEVIALEQTGFGKTREGLKFAGTADFIMKINNKTVIGDYKCVTDNTDILMADGSLVKASELIIGDEVVAWSEAKGLHSSPVSFIGDNGVKPIIKVTTELGQTLECTENHPILVSRKNSALTWVKAEDIEEGDVVQVALGWSHNPSHKETEWPLPHGLSPYVYGVLWTLYNMRGELTYDSVIRLPKISRDSLKYELKDLGFKENRKGQIIAKGGLDKISNKAKWTPQMVIDSLSVSLPDFVMSASRSVKDAFLCGVQEVFYNPEVYPGCTYVVLKEDKSLDDLLSLYLGLGVVANKGIDPNSGLKYVKLPSIRLDTIFTHGAHSVRITKKERLAPASTIALEIEGSHTHVTNGIITHNTNRSGLHAEVSLQLAANARTSTDGSEKTIYDSIDSAIGVHISPKGVTVKEISISDGIFEYFEALRKAWDYASFEGKIESETGVFLREIKSPEDI